MGLGFSDWLILVECAWTNVDTLREGHYGRKKNWLIAVKVNNNYSIYMCAPVLLWRKDSEGRHGGVLQNRGNPFKKKNRNYGNVVHKLNFNENVL